MNDPTKPTLYAMTADQRRRFLALLARAGGGPPWRGGRWPSGYDVAILRAADLVSTDPRPHHKAYLRDVAGLADADHADAGAEYVYLADLGGGELAPESEYLAVRGGSHDDRPLFWCQGGGGPDLFFAVVGVGSDEFGYPITQTVLTGPNTWGTPPDAVTGTGYRAPSWAIDPGPPQSPPDIPAGQVVLARRTTYPPMAFAVSYIATAGTVLFTDVTPSGGTGPYTYSWDFGDGDTSAGDEPSHTYAGPGPYTVAVTVTDGGTPARVQTFEFDVPDTAAGEVTPAVPAAAPVVAYELSPWGGVQAVTFATYRYTCVGDDLEETATTVTIRGRDLTVQET